jgi:hypothetical protein
VPGGRVALSDSTFGDRAPAVRLGGLVDVVGRTDRSGRLTMALYYWLIIALLVAIIGTLLAIRQRQVNS